MHRLGHPELSIMFLELAERHALWTRAATQKQGEEKGGESFHDMLSRLIDGRERRAASGVRIEN